MLKDPIEGFRLISELYKFNQSNRLDFYAFVRAILEHSQCAIITEPYWDGIEGVPGGEVFTLFPELVCTVCEGEEQFKCKDVHKFTNHVVFCLSKKDVLKGEDDARLFLKYGVVPKAVKSVVDEARSKRDHQSLCIAPVLDHHHIKELADLQRRERDKITDQMARELKVDKINGPFGVFRKLAKGAEMPLDRSVWIQTPLTSELATLLLAGMQPIRHSSTGIHLPVVFRDTGITKVIHLNIDRFEELAAVRMPEQNWDMMKLELQQVNLPTDGNGRGNRKRNAATGNPNESFNKIFANGLSSKPLLTEQMITQKCVDAINKERTRVDKERVEAENREEKVSLVGTSNVNGDLRPRSASSNEQPGCSKIA